MTSYDNLKQSLNEIFGTNGGEIRLFFAPGRVNLIGDHTDYSGGHVFPCAIREGITAAVRTRSDNLIKFASLEDPGIRTISTEESFEYNPSDGWVNCVKGAVSTLREQGFRLPHGLEILYLRDVPAGVGLASSAAYEVLTALIAREVYRLEGIDELSLALISQKTDSGFFHGARGIMDSLASAAGRENCGLLLSVSKLKYEYVPLRLTDAKLVVTMSGVNYAEREKFEPLFERCRKALKKLKSVAYIENLCNLTWDKFESCKDVIMDEDATKMARHVIYEDMRTIRAVSALRVGNFRRLGQMMKESHLSLRDNCGVTCPEIDYLAEAAWEIPGVIGSRMTGAGFGGSTVSIVENGSIDEFRERIRKGYLETFGLEAKFLVTSAGNGAGEILG